jgi:ankyrin repeat protein
MADFETLMQAAKQGSVEDVRLIIEHHPEFLNRRDQSGATALHHAAFGGHREVVRLLVRHGADINTHDDQFGATPAGWAIEYLRELGGYLGIELDDFAHALRRADVEWVARFLDRFPGLRDAADKHGTPFREFARQSGNQEIMRLF